MSLIQSFNLKVESPIQEFLKLDSEILEHSSTYFTHLPNDSDSFTDFFLCKCFDLYLKFLKANLKTTLDLSIPVYGFLLKRLVVLA